jgi:hypothetical protein
MKAYTCTTLQQLKEAFNK